MESFPGFYRQSDLAPEPVKCRYRPERASPMASFVDDKQNHQSQKEQHEYQPQDANAEEIRQLH
jgi:hypothetical protein